LKWLESESAPPIALLDWMMPKISGVELCARVRRHARELAPYLLMLTARTEKKDVTQGLDAGADDYLTKPFELSELGARLRVAKRAIGQQRDLIAARELIRYRTSHDLATGALNRGAILAASFDALATGELVSVLLFAVDDYKAIQERCGAQHAESLVCTLVQRVRAASPSAVIGRYAPDELLVLLDGACLDDAYDVAELVRQQIERDSCSVGVRLDTGFSVSAGVACNHDADSLELLLCYADTALHAAKLTGNAVETFALQLQSEAAEGVTS
jgi:diguanylate cyclase (GGDEF)-like protein